MDFGRLAFGALLRAVEYGAVDKAAFIDYVYHVGVGGDGAVAFLEHFILQAAGRCLHAYFLGVFGQELLAGFLVGAVEFFELLVAVALEVLLHVLLHAVHVELEVLALGAGNESAEEVLHADVLRAVFAEELVVDVAVHLGTELLADLDTGKVGGFLLVVTGVGALHEALVEFAHVGCVHAQGVGQIHLQTL